MSDLKFTRTHEWLKLEDNEAVVGITDHAQQLLGDMVYVDLPEKGKLVNLGDELGVVESVKAASDFYAPVAGVVTSVNNQLLDNPGLVNSDPYGAGWLVKMKMENPDELNALLSESQYQETMLEEK